MSEPELERRGAHSQTQVQEVEELEDVVALGICAVQGAAAREREEVERNVAAGGQRAADALGKRAPVEQHAEELDTGVDVRIGQIEDVLRFRVDVERERVLDIREDRQRDQRE